MHRGVEKKNVVTTRKRRSTGLFLVTRDTKGNGKEGSNPSWITEEESLESKRGPVERNRKCRLTSMHEKRGKNDAKDKQAVRNGESKKRAFCAH